MAHNALCCSVLLNNLSSWRGLTLDWRALYVSLASTVKISAKRIQRDSCYCKFLQLNVLSDCEGDFHDFFPGSLIIAAAVFLFHGKGK